MFASLGGSRDHAPAVISTRALNITRLLNVNQNASCFDRHGLSLTVFLNELELHVLKEELLCHRAEKNTAKTLN